MYRAPRFVFRLSLLTMAIGVLAQQPQRAMACPVGGCTNASFYGDYAFSSSSNGSTRIGIVGVIHTDGAGNITGGECNLYCRFEQSDRCHDRLLLQWEYIQHQLRWYWDN